MGATPAINRSYGRRRKSLRTQMEEESAINIRGQHQTFSKTPGINRSYGQRLMNAHANTDTEMSALTKTLDFGMDMGDDSPDPPKNDQFVDKIHSFGIEMELFAKQSPLKLSNTAQQQLQVAMEAIHKLEQILRKQPGDATIWGNANLEKRAKVSFAKQDRQNVFVGNDDDGKENDNNLLMNLMEESSDDDDNGTTDFLL